MRGDEALFLIAAFLFFTLLFLVIFYGHTPKPKQEIQKSLTSYVCSKNNIEYILFDGRFMVLSVDQNGNPVKCTHE